MMQPGIYVHVPFCSAVCPYCDFAVTVGRQEKRRAYVDSLLREIELVASGREMWDEFDTLYLGGGTPSLLAAADLERLMAALRRDLPLEAAAHLFFEANPEDVDPERLAAWRDLGIATLSIGIQSFSASELAFLGRRHTPIEARVSVELARAAGFEAVSVDLIYGLPGQSAADWQHQLETALALEPDHLSCYELEVHERTVFGKRLARGELQEMPEEAQAELFVLTHEFLAAHGYEGYEVSNFARSPEYRSRHNRKYWYHVPYLGLGMSAHSFNGVERRWNERSLPLWEKRVAAGESPIAGRETLAPNDRALEAVMLQSRTREGLDIERFSQVYGVDLEAHNRATFERWQENGLAEIDRAGDRIIAVRPTVRGLALADGLAAAVEIETADRGECE